MPFWLPVAVLLGVLGLESMLTANLRGEDKESRRKDFLLAYEKTKTLTQPRVLDLLGKPDRKARQILYRRYMEQWVYDAPVGLCVEFEVTPGRDGRVVSVYPLSGGKS
jgi:hypothetical protein